MEQEWFEMKDVLKRTFANAVWLPIRATQQISRTGRLHHLGFSEEFFGAGSALILNSARKIAESLGWSDIGISHDHHPYMERGRYKPADIFRDNAGKQIGINL